jgi:ribosomal protein S30
MSERSKGKGGFKTKSTHGSITKAGKVRQQTPKVRAAEHTSLNPRQRTRRRYRLLKLQERLARRGRLEFEHVKLTRRGGRTW